MLNTSILATTPLPASESFTGGKQSRLRQLMAEWVKLAAFADQDGTIIFQTSNDAETWTDEKTLSVTANELFISEWFSAGKQRYFRVKFTNSSANDQTFLYLAQVLGIDADVAATKAANQPE